MADWEEAFYQKQLASMPNLASTRLADLLMKTDDPVLSSTTGVSTVLYGARVYDNLYRESTLWQVLPKAPYAERGRGVRLLTADSATAAGITETGGLVDTDKPDFIQYYITPKRFNYTWDVTEVAQIVSTVEDGKPGGEAAFEADYAASYFASALDDKLSYDADTTASANPESIDRGICNTSIDQNCVAADGSAYDAGDNDIYSQDRDSASTTDATCDSGVGHNSGTKRALTLSIIDQTMLAAMKNGFKSERGVIMTGYDTFGDWSALMSSQQRFDDFVEVTFSVNGVESAKGRPAGVRVAAYQGVPIILNKNLVYESSGATRIYGMDLDGVEFRVMSPVRHLMLGNEYAIAHDVFAERHSLDILGELTFTKFASHWTVRDLA